MSETKFTPGPWRISAGNIGNAIEAQSGKNVHEFDDGFRILATFQPCEPTGKYLEEQENAKANANLIAAAPEMYAVLAWLNCRGGLGSDVHKSIDAALAKARGEA